MHLRTHGQWPDGAPDWAKDHNGRMNDSTAMQAVIEELVEINAQKGPTQQTHDAPAAFIRASDLERSEEHTSELQSLMRISYAVFCLNKNNTIHCMRMTHSITNYTTYL